MMNRNIEPHLNVRSLHENPNSGQKYDRRIGAILVASGVLTTEEAERILRLQKEKGLRFGEAALKLRLINQADIDHVLSAQFDYPYLLAGESKVSREVIAAYEPFSKEVEDLRALRSELLLRWFGFEPDLKLLAITSPMRREGRSYLAANLAVVFSQLGERTLLIDADLRNPRQHSLFGLANNEGLSTILSGRNSGTMAECVPNLLDLSILTAGVVPPNPAELLARPLFSEWLGEQVKNFDVILIDTPAGVASADVQSIVAHAGGALIVARKDYTRMRDMSALSEKIKGANAQIVGTVLNNF